MDNGFLPLIITGNGATATPLAQPRLERQLLQATRKAMSMQTWPLLSTCYPARYRTNRRQSICNLHQ